MPQNNSYFIAVTIPEPLNTEIEDIKRKISIEYQTKSVLKSPSHITIVPPFFWSNEEELLTMVQQFSFPEFNIQLSGYKTFPIGVVFIDVKNNEQMDQLHISFSDVFFRDFPQLKKKPHFPFQPHITVGNRDWKKEQFNRCWNDMKDKNFETEFSYKKLTLLKNTNGLWKSL